MSATDTAREALAKALAAIPAPHGVTALRCKAAIENALGEVEANLSLLAWEQGRKSRELAQRAEREALRAASDAKFRANVERVEKRAR